MNMLFLVQTFLFVLGYLNPTFTRTTLTLRLVNINLSKPYYQNNYYLQTNQKIPNNQTKQSSYSCTTLKRNLNFLLEELQKNLQKQSANETKIYYIEREINNLTLHHFSREFLQSQQDILQQEINKLQAQDRILRQRKSSLDNQVQRTYQELEHYSCPNSKPSNPIQIPPSVPLPRSIFTPPSGNF